MGQTCHVGQKCLVPPSMVQQLCRPSDTMHPSWISVDETEEGGDAISIVAKDAAQVTCLHGQSCRESEPRSKIETRHVQNLSVPQGGTYTGEVSEDNQPHGEGTQRWLDGTSYSGSWSWGAAHGKGELVKADGSGYSGHWVEGRKHGVGRESLLDGSEYKGEFADGQKHGHGAFQWRGGASYSGQFCEDSLQGEGIFIWGDGRTYHGQWVQNKMHGQGRFEWPDGKSFEGKYEGDQKHGPGMFVWPDGSKMIGVWQHGKQHGVGTHVTAKGMMRRGRWKNGVLEHWIDGLTECRQDPRNAEKPDSSDIYGQNVRPTRVNQLAPTVNWRPEVRLDSDGVADGCTMPLPAHDFIDSDPEQDMETL
mmetsp:Transcript_59976/g.111234  ORF Transcript_59976/g.111234 Transcript_59976/m.111234 type:complete len:363 (-) Transcript_59976:143-1231(-)